MEKKRRITIWAGSGSLAAFALWTWAVCRIGVQPIGPNGSRVGFGEMNHWFHQLTGVHMGLYTVTDWLGLVPVCFVLGFGLLGLVQLIRSRSLRKVDPDILLLGGFYILVLGAYLLFEALAVNYRPILIDGYLEASYPSSTTLLALCVIPTGMLQLHARLQSRTLRRSLLVLLGAFTGFMVIGRLLSGVHWLTDIIGGVLLSAGLVLLYQGLSGQSLTG